MRLGLLLLGMLVLSGCGHRPLAPVGTLENTPPPSKPHSDRKSTSVQPKSQPISAIHIVRPGDTLYSISWHYGQDYKQLAADNGIKAPYTIHVGQRIRLTPHKTNNTASTQTTIKTQQPTAITPLNWRWPTQGKIIEGFSNSEPGNKGIDIIAKAGQAIYATAAGKVVYAGSGLAHYGKLLIIKHNELYLSAYAHNQSLLVTEGQQVAGGQKIALMGKTGTQRVKLHFEIRYDGRPIDPLPLLPKLQ